MKKIVYTLTAVAAILLAACGDNRPTEGNKLELSISGAEKVTTPDDYNIFLGSNIDQLMPSLIAY